MLHLRNMATAAVIGATGDVLMQHRERPRGPAELDTGRTARLVCYRMVHAPVIDSCWRYFERRIPFGGAPRVAALVFADQALLMPPSVFCFFLSQGVMEGRSVEESLARARDTFLPNASICLPYWCTVHVFTFGVFAARWRMAWASLCGVGWNAICSWQNQDAIMREQQRERRTAAAAEVYR